MRTQNALAYYERNDDGSLRTATIINPEATLPEVMCPGMEADSLRINGDFGRHLVALDYDGDDR